MLSQTVLTLHAEVETWKAQYDKLLRLVTGVDDTKNETATASVNGSDVLGEDKTNSTEPASM